VCGRFTLATPAEALAELLGLAEAPVVPPRYNIAPGQPVAAVGRRGPGQPTRLSLLHWGFEREGGGLLINARLETAHRLPAFRQAFRSRRCLVPADGFYEWQRLAGRKQAFHVRRADGRPFAFAGLWQPRPGRDPAAACVLLTTAPNELMAPIHDRMPVVLTAEACRAWIDPELQDPLGVASLLLPSPAEDWRAVPVSSRVNHVANDDASLIVPA